MSNELNHTLSEIHNILDAFNKAIGELNRVAESLVTNMHDAITIIEEVVAVETKSHIGQGPVEDTREDTQFKEADAPHEADLSKYREFDLGSTLVKYRTYFEDGRPRGWLLKLVDENDRETDEGNHWLCSIMVKWIQELPTIISERDENDSRDRSYPAKSKRSIYVNDAEMRYIEELAEEQGVLVQEKEFER